jgi:hypothetical protein
MALQNTDLFVLYRPSTKTNYKLAASELTEASLPDGTEEGDILEWKGSNWVPSTIDGGTF